MSERSQNDRMFNNDAIEEHTNMKRSIRLLIECSCVEYAECTQMFKTDRNMCEKVNHEVI